MTPNFQRKHSSEPCIPSRHIGNGYGHFLDIDTNEQAPYNPGRRASDRRRSDKLKINIPKTPEMSEDESSEDPNKNIRKKMLFIGFVYVASISFIALEYYIFYNYKYK
jgi:hypothetical protein